MFVKELDSGPRGIKGLKVLTLRMGLAEKGHGRCSSAPGAAVHPHILLPAGLGHSSFFFYDYSFSSNSLLSIHHVPSISVLGPEISFLNEGKSLFLKVFFLGGGVRG